MFTFNNTTREVLGFTLMEGFFGGSDWDSILPEDFEPNIHTVNNNAQIIYCGI